MGRSAGAGGGAERVRFENLRQRKGKHEPDGKKGANKGHRPAPTGRDVNSLSVLKTRNHWTPPVPSAILALTFTALA